MTEIIKILLRLIASIKPEESLNDKQLVSAEKQKALIDALEAEDRKI